RTRDGECTVGDVGGALRVEDMIGAELINDAIDGEDGVKRDGVVVSLEADERGGERAYDGDGLAGLEGERVGVVLEKDHGFAGGAEGELGILRRVDVAEGDGGEGDALRRVEHAEAHARGEEALDDGVELRIGEEVVLHGGSEGFVGGAAVEVRAGDDGEGGAM